MVKLRKPLNATETATLVALLERAIGERVERPVKGCRAEWVATIFAAVKAPHDELTMFNESQKTKRREFRRDL